MARQLRPTPYPQPTRRMSEQSADSGNLLEMKYATGSVPPRLEIREVPQPRRLVFEDMVNMPSLVWDWNVARSERNPVNRNLLVSLYDQASVKTHWHQSVATGLSAGIVGMAHKQENNRKKVFLVMQHNRHTSKMSVVLQFMPSDISQAEVVALVTAPVYRSLVIAAWTHIQGFPDDFTIEGRHVSTYAVDMLPPPS